MKWSIWVLALAFHGNAGELKFESNYLNKVSVGIDGHLRYERVLPKGFRLGTDWKYETVMEGERLIHFDQRPEAWLLTASHLWDSKLLIWENRMSFGKYDGHFSVILDSGIRKPFRFEDRWAIAPFIKIIRYVFDPGAYEKEWPSLRVAHHGEFKTELGLELELLF